MKYIVCALSIVCCILACFYFNSLIKIEKLNGTIDKYVAEIATLETKMKDIVAAANSYKQTTEDLITKYADDLNTTQQQILDTRLECDRRIDLYKSAKSEDVKKQPTVLDTNSSTNYVKELNKRLRNTKLLPDTTTVK